VTIPEMPTMRASRSPPPANSQIVTPITPIVIQPRVPECRCVSRVSRESAPKIRVAFARPSRAVSAKIPSPYWNAR
jgi:hypothetical protein